MFGAKGKEEPLAAPLGVAREHAAPGSTSRSGNRSLAPWVSRSGETGGVRPWALGSGQWVLEPAEDSNDRAGMAEGQLQAPTVGDDAGRDVDRILHHGAQASAHGWMARFSAGLWHHWMTPRRGDDRHGRWKCMVRRSGPRLVAAPDDD